MLNYSLPTDVIIDNRTYPINKSGDYRMILDIISAVNDKDLSESVKTYCALNIFYDFKIPENTQRAVEEMQLFINCGEMEGKKTDKPPLVNWEKDFSILVAPINKALGVEIRSLPYLHWWTFIGGYMEIGECQFSTIIGIRTKLQKGQKLEKWEQEYYNENRSKVELKSIFTEQEEKVFNKILGK